MRSKGKQRMEKYHNFLVNGLAKRLSKKGKSHIKKNMNYFVEGIQGEVDVLAYCPETKTYHFYEVKCNYYCKSYNKAVGQFLKYKETHPNQNVKGIFVSPQYTWRMKI